MPWENSRYLPSEFFLRQKSHTDTIIPYIIQIKSDFRKEQRSSSPSLSALLRCKAASPCSTADAADAADAADTRRDKAHFPGDHGY